MKSYGEEGEDLCGGGGIALPFLTSTLEVSDHHSLVALALEERAPPPPHQLCRRPGGLQSPSERCGVERNFMPLLGTEH
jgi:hypothetical protein